MFYLCVLKKIFVFIDLEDIYYKEATELANELVLRR